MHRRIQSLKQATPFLSGLLIGTSMVTPVFAATSVGADGWQPVVLLGSAVLLVVALALKAVAARQTRRADDAGELSGDASQLGSVLPRHTGTIGDFRVAARWNP